ncbi:MAG: O-antigen ligase family protein [Candidatus Sericytochromatia bacterium]|nr:O-antigen ligase family protein [Candidatus Sericytochromatia bacterium]
MTELDAPVASSAARDATEAGGVARLAAGLDRAFGPLLAFAVIGTVFALPRFLDDPFKIGAEAFAVAMAWVLATLGLTTQALRGEGLAGPVPREPAWWLLAAFGGWAALSSLWVPHPALHVRFALTLAAYLLAGHAVLAWLARDPAGRRGQAVALLAALTALQAGLGLLQWARVPISALAKLGPVGSLWEGIMMALGAPSRMATPMGSFGNQNYLAECLALTLPLVLGFSLAQARPARRWMGLGVVAVGFVVLLGCSTRAAVIGLVLGGGTALLATGAAGDALARLRPRDARGWLMRGVVVLALGAAGVTFGGPLVAKFARLGAPDANTDSRLGNWQVGLHMVTERPWTGAGLGGWKIGSVEAMHRAHPEGLSEALAVARFHQLHSDPLQAFVELGLVGGGLASAAMLAWVRRVRRSALPRVARFGLIWGLTAIVVASAFGFPFHVALSALAVVVALAIGLTPDAPAPAPEPAPAWLPGYAVAVALVVGGLGWQAYGRGMWPAYVASHLQHLAAHTEKRVPLGPTHGILYGAALRVDPFKPTHLFARLNTLIKQQRYAEAAQVFEAHRGEGPGSDSMLLYARALEELKRVDDARAIYRRVCLSYPPRMRNHQLAARHLAALGGTNPRQAELDAVMRQPPASR